MQFPPCLTFPIAVILCVGAIEGAIAYSNPVRNNMLKSRDGLLDQRSKLEQTYNALGTQIAQMQRQRTTVYSYLRDVDGAIRDVDRALSSQDSSYRGRR